MMSSLPSERHASELMLLSVVSAWQREPGDGLQFSPFVLDPSTSFMQRSAPLRPSVTCVVDLGEPLLDKFAIFWVDEAPTP
jgi:hypothetical protein